MSNIEHLIENALIVTENCDDKYEAFKKEMRNPKNRYMLQQVAATEQELWEIVQYLFYTWFPNQPDNIGE